MQFRRCEQHFNASGGSKVTTVYDTIASAPHAPLAQYDDHSTNTIVTAAWLRANAARTALWKPPALTTEIARTEG